VADGNVCFLKIRKEEQLMNTLPRPGAAFLSQLGLRGKFTLIGLIMGLS